jgi:hypothetical protein
VALGQQLEEAPGVVAGEAAAVGVAAVDRVVREELGLLGQRAQLARVEVERRPGRGALGQHPPRGPVERELLQVHHLMGHGHHVAGRGGLDPDPPGGPVVAGVGADHAPLGAAVDPAVDVDVGAPVAVIERLGQVQAALRVAQRALGVDQELLGRLGGDRVGVARSARVVHDEALRRRLLGQVARHPGEVARGQGRLCQAEYGEDRERQKTRDRAGFHLPHPLERTSRS